MRGIVLRVYEDSSGKLYFRSDLPGVLSRKDALDVIARVRLAMVTELRGAKETAVNAAIRQLAFGAMMCAEDPERRKAEFRAEVEEYLPLVTQMDNYILHAENEQNDVLQNV